MQVESKGMGGGIFHHSQRGRVPLIKRCLSSASVGLKRRAVTSAAPTSMRGRSITHSSTSGKSIAV